MSDGWGHSPIGGRGRDGGDGPEWLAWFDLVLYIGVAIGVLLLPVILLR